MNEKELKKEIIEMIMKFPNDTNGQEGLRKAYKHIAWKMDVDEDIRKPKDLLIDIYYFIKGYMVARSIE